MGGRGEGQPTDLAAHEWQLSVGYRYLYADQWFFGTQQTTPPAGLFGQPVDYHIHTLNVSLVYALSARYSLHLAVPVLFGNESIFFPDTVRHTNTSHGLGDIVFAAYGWLLDPATHRSGNVALGLGVKPPTGDYRYAGAFYFPNGNAVQAAVDPAIGLGDGGWGILFDLNAYQRILPRTNAYLTASYLLSPRDTTDVIRRPDILVYRSVPDVYAVRAGLSYRALPEHGVTVLFGGSVDGIPYHDQFGGSHGFRRPGHVVLVDPGMSWSQSWGTISVTTPIRVHGHLATMSQIAASGKAIAAGDLAKALLFLTYSRRL